MCFLLPPTALAKGWFRTKAILDPTFLAFIFDMMCQKIIKRIFKNKIAPVVFKYEVTADLQRVRYKGIYSRNEIRFLVLAPNPRNLSKTRSKYF